MTATTAASTTARPAVPTGAHRATTRGLINDLDSNVLIVHSRIGRKRAPHSVCIWGSARPRRVSCGALDELDAARERTGPSTSTVEHISRKTTQTWIGFSATLEMLRKVRRLSDNDDQKQNPVNRKTLHPNKVRVLAVLADASYMGITVGQIAHRVQMPSNTVSTILSQFRDNRWAEHYRDPGDARLRRYRLTTGGLSEYLAWVQDEMNPDTERVVIVLVNAPDGGWSISEVARRANLGPDRVKKLLVRLEENGWVRWERPPGDYRRHCYLLTERGRTTHAALVMAHQTHDQGVPNQ